MGTYDSHPNDNHIEYLRELHYSHLFKSLQMPCGLCMYVPMHAITVFNFKTPCIFKTIFQMQVKLKMFGYSEE